MSATTEVLTDWKKTRISAGVIIDASIERVWEALKDPAEIEQFHPLIKRARVTSDQSNGLGTTRNCQLLPMGEMDECITEWREMEAVTYEVTGGKMLPPYHWMKGRLQLEPRGAHTQVNFTFSYRLKFGPLGRLMDTLMIRPQFKKAPGKYVTGLKAYVEKRSPKSTSPTS